ncbi:Hypothetical protein NCS54_01496200 [Fusarium falciforme]|uniref:Hypothetical protein n=1 Tax=Fusarium falciforme TaxID=195108 RepID=UPI002300388B|nr:Hypothetical protein NCS54_01496200 [Fusarium falciforme]WAO97246.1 Hypothetical protein NCS54_01496200 [Fusarium falciforme]
MSFAILNTWIALAGPLGLVIPSGGSTSYLYGFFSCVICNFTVVASLGEIAAIWPKLEANITVSMFFALRNGEESRYDQSFVAGWINITGWLTLVTTEGFFAAQFISAASVIASDGRYEPRQWATYLIFLAILSFAAVSNIWGNKNLGRWNDAALYWSLLSVIIISIVLLSLSKKTSPEFVFTNFQNETGWSNGVAWILGLLQSALSLIGFDAVLHMTEKMLNPRKDAPRAMMYAIGVGGATGTLFILVMLFCLDDPSSAMTTSTGIPIVELIFQSTGSRVAGCIMGIMLGICFINGTNACTTSVSRLMFAIARDNGIIFHEYFAHIDPRLNVPVRTILFSFVFNALFGLLHLGPAVALNAFIASCTIFLNVSYALPVLVLLLRGRRILAQYQSRETPFQLGFKRGTLINWVTVIYVTFTSVVGLNLVPATWVFR